MCWVYLNSKVLPSTMSSTWAEVALASSVMWHLIHSLPNFSYKPKIRICHWKQHKWVTCHLTVALSLPRQKDYNNVTVTCANPATLSLHDPPLLFLYLSLNDIAEDRGPTIGGWRIPLEVDKVLVPVQRLHIQGRSGDACRKKIFWLQTFALKNHIFLH